MKKTLYVLILIFSFTSFAVDEKKPAKPAGKANVLDFEADVIEGKKAKPDLFLQMDTDNKSLDSLIYMRNDFNDFHKSDSRRIMHWTGGK